MNHRRLFSSLALVTVFFLFSQSFEATSPAPTQTPQPPLPPLAAEPSMKHRPGSPRLQRQAVDWPPP